MMVAINQVSGKKSQVFAIISLNYKKKPALDAAQLVTIIRSHFTAEAVAVLCISAILMSESV